MADTVRIELSQDQALVLFEFLARFDAAQGTMPLDSAAQKVLWVVEAALEKILVAPLAKDYDRLLQEARERVLNEPSGSSA
jgi:hypothetical protein